MIHTRGLPEAQIPTRTKVPDYAHLLPAEVGKFTSKGVYSKDDEQHLSFTQGGGHGGSHPHLTHTFIEAVRGNRLAFPDASASANWTLVGICAHESAMAGGTRVEIPVY